MACRAPPPTKLHEERSAVGDRIHLGGAGQGGDAVVSRERGLELTHRLRDLADRVVRLGGFRRGRCAPGPIHRLVEPVELFQRQRLGGERARMHGREGEERVERAQGSAGRWRAISTPARLT